MELVLVKIDSPEWEYIWDYIKNHPINQGIEEPTTALNNGYGWEYMGTFMQEGKALHQLRHFCHPNGNYTRTISLQASSSFTSEQVLKKFKL